MRCGPIIASVSASVMWKIFWPNAAFLFLTKPSGYGARKFGTDYAKRLKKKQGRLGDTWHLDEVFVRISGQQQYLWRAVDQDGDVIDIMLQSRRDQHAAERFFRRLVRGQGKEPFRIITDKLKSYGAAKRTILPGVTHDTQQYANNRAELSHRQLE